MIYIILLFFFLSSVNAQPLKEIPVSVFKVKEETIKQFYKTHGVFKSDRSIFVKPEVSGRVVNILVNEGDFVERGTPLITIQTDKYDYQYSSQLYIVKKLQSIYNYKKSIYKKKKILFEKELISEDEYKVAELEMENAYNDLRSAEEKLKELKRLKEKTVIKAPFSGFIDKKLVSEGDFVNSTTSLFYLVDIDSLKLNFELPQRFVNTLKIGDRIEIGIEGIGSIKGSVSYISYSLTDNSLLRYKATPEYVEGLRENMYAVVSILEREMRGFKIPEKAIHMSQKGNFVFVVENGIAKRKEVQILEQTFGYILVSGLKEGDMVVVSAPFGIREGSKVYIEEKK